MESLILALFEHISAFEVFGTLVPGLILAVALDELFFQHALSGGGNLKLIVIAYCLGIIASRLGSLLSDRLSSRLGVTLRISYYNDFIQAEKRDAKIDILQSVSNLYRTLMGSCLIVAYCACARALRHAVGQAVVNVVVDVLTIGLLTLLFLLSWRKQERYVEQRARAQAGDQEANGG